MPARYRAIKYAATYARRMRGVGSCPTRQGCVTQTWAREFRDVAAGRPIPGCRLAAVQPSRMHVDAAFTPVVSSGWWVEPSHGQAHHASHCRGGAMERWPSPHAEREGIPGPTEVRQRQKRGPPCRSPCLQYPRVAKQPSKVGRRQEVGSHAACPDDAIAAGKRRERAHSDRGGLREIPPPSIAGETPTCARLRTDGAVWA